ncbi:MAG: UvrD-helicase domain-containing protein [Terriglobales bacterium]|jgi:mRNA-degrading endonuclease RelE of RelBE toxin-antitoxin system
MEFRIADTFTDSLARLSGDDQKAVKTTAFDLQLNPSHPSLQFHKLAKAKDPNFWSIRVSRDVRLIVHKTGTSLLLCYVDHHDEAYQWAERRKVETHPKTGAAQLVEIRERVQEIAIPKYVEVESKPEAKPPLFSALSDEQLLAFGVPREWLGDARSANEDSVLDLAEHLPAEAAEALLNLAIVGAPRTTPDVEPSVHAYAPSARLDAAKVSEPTLDAFNHPDAQRRFRAISSQEELERAFEYPWEKWTIFLHPAQRQLVERDYSGPARISGSAGTGKTIVALHRAVHLARANPETRLLLTTFSETLANALRSKLRLLISNEPRLGERIEVHAMNSIGRRLHEVNLGKLQIASGETIRQIIEDASNAAQGNRFSLHFLLTEWEQVVDGWQLDTWEAYRDVLRLGRRTRLKEPQRALLWSIFEDVRSRLRSKEIITYSGMFNRLASQFEGSALSPFDFVVVDEAQDVSIAQLRFLAALGAGRPNKLFFAGDLGQRIFQQPFSWKALRVDVRGRSTTLRINYRTSHQIRIQADRLLGPEVSDVDGNVEDRRATVSLFNGPLPIIKILNNVAEETRVVGEWLKARTSEGVQPHEVAVFVRSSAELERAKAAAEYAGLPLKVLDENVETASGKISIGTMHLAKGLEFRAVAVMACEDEVIPLQERIETVADDADLEDVYNTERQLLYVACTRPRDHLLVTSVAPASEFLDDLLK